MIQIQRQSNSAVTDYYLDVIGGMCAKKEELYGHSHPLSECKKNDIIIVPTATDFLKVYLRGFRRIVYWMQGIDSEESYLKHHSMFRKKLLDWVTLFALKRAKAIFFVSDAMKRYEERKFGIKLDERSFIMPCFNVSKETGINFNEEKYAKNVFAYVGSLSQWQCFSQTVDFYKRIEDRWKDVEFRVFTFSEDEAKGVLSEKGVRNYSVRCVAPDQMTTALKDVKFGFVLRDNIPVNNVATPTKLSSYLSAGVIPVYSTSLIDFHDKTRDFTYSVPIEDYTQIPKKLEELMSNHVNYNLLCKEYNFLFDTYYNPNYYTNMYQERLCRLL